MNPLVSVVIPVYNVENYLDACLKSIVSQTLHNIEIIVVNDGSTDNSRNIITQYTSQDSRIKVVDKENEGLAFARKSGVEAATGTYIQHLDGDDYLEPNALELLYHRAVETDADMVVFPFWFDFIEENKKKASRPTTGVYDSVSFFQSMAFCHNYWSVWSYLHKRSLYANILFEKELSYGEDVYLSSQLTYFAHKIIVIDSHPLLHYVIRKNSISLGSFTEKKAQNIELYPRLQRKFYQDKPTYQQVEEALANVELGAIVLLLSKRWLHEASRLARRAIEIEKQFPRLLHQRPARHYRMLLKAYAHSEFLGRCMLQYYLLTRKIK